MRRMLKLLIVMFVLYFGIQYLYYALGKGHDLTYIILYNNKEITVEEKLTSYKNVSDGYFFNIKFDDYSIPFKVLKKYNKQKKMVSAVNIYYGDIYVCVDIKLKKEDDISDIKCSKDNIIYYYNTIKGRDSKLDKSIEATTYEILKYQSDTQAYDKEKIKYYPMNYVEQYNLALSYYKGLYLFGNGILSNARLVSLFSDDQYEKEIEGVVNNYYIVADYNSSHNFYNFYSVNITTGSNNTITSSNSISFSSFVQGSLDGKLYIMDAQNKKQYIIDPKKRVVEEVGNENTGILIYTKDGWVTKNANEVIDGKIKFYDNSVDAIDGNKYENIKLYGNEYGVYYYYIKNGSAYDAYMIYAQDENQTKHYLFSTTDIKRIKYIDDYVYYIYNDEIRVFGPRSGIRTIIKFSEIKFNEKLNYYVY